MGRTTPVASARGRASPSDNFRCSLVRRGVATIPTADSVLQGGGRRETRAVQRAVSGLWSALLRLRGLVTTSTSLHPDSADRSYPRCASVGRRCRSRARRTHQSPSGGSTILRRTDVFAVARPHHDGSLYRRGCRLVLPAANYRGRAEPPYDGARERANPNGRTVGRARCVSKPRGHTNRRVSIYRRRSAARRPYIPPAAVFPVRRIARFSRYKSKQTCLPLTWARRDGDS